MNREKAAAALAAYDALYKVPNEDRYIIDGDEAQVAADLAAVVRSQQAKPTAEDIVAHHLEDFGARLTKQPHQDYLAALKSTMLAAVEEALS